MRSGSVSTTAKRIMRSLTVSDGTGRRSGVRSGANGGREEYGAYRAQDRAERAGCRMRSPWSVTRSWLWEIVSELLVTEAWSPQQLANTLKRDHPDDPEWWVSHESIYQALYVQGKGDLKAQFRQAVRSGRTRRKPRSRPVRADSRDQIAGLVNISKRPPDVDDRAVPGHWEGARFAMVNGTAYPSQQVPAGSTGTLSTVEGTASSAESSATPPSPKSPETPKAKPAMRNSGVSHDACPTVSTGPSEPMPCHRLDIGARVGHQQPLHESGITRPSPHPGPRTTRPRPRGGGSSRSNRLETSSRGRREITPTPHHGT